MGIKIIKFCLVLLLSIISSVVFAEDIVRVGITDNSFQRVKHSDVKVYATEDYVICDKDSRQILAMIPKSKKLRIVHEEDSFLVALAQETPLLMIEKLRQV